VGDIILRIEDLTLQEKVGQMLLFAFHGTEYNEQISAFIAEFNLGGIVYFYRNIKNIAQVAALNQRIQNEAKIPLFIGLDQEGGPVLRIMEGITPLPGAMALASTPSCDIYRISAAVGKDLKHLGFNINFAPVGDVNNNPYNPVINSRSYSDNPEFVALCAVAAAQGFQESSILPTIKHFPGHGNTAIDSHRGLPLVKSRKKDLERIELVPFRRAFAAGIDGVMVSHILFSAYDRKFPASLSYNIITKLLKRKMKFKGLICTDSLTMGAISTHYSLAETIRLAVNAGNDLLIFCGKADLSEQREIYQTFLNLVKQKKISERRIDESVRKLLSLKQKYVSKTINLTSVNRIEDRELAGRLQAESITLVVNGGLIPLSSAQKTLILFPKLKIFSLIDNENQRYKSLGNYLAADEIIIDSETDNLSEIVQISKKYDIILLATYNVCSGDWQQRLFNALDKTKTIVVSLRSPYDMLHLSGVENYICIYEATDHSLYYLSLCLLGKRPFFGKLPIKLEVKSK